MLERFTKVNVIGSKLYIRNQITISEWKQKPKEKKCIEINKMPEGCLTSNRQIFKNLFNSNFDLISNLIWSLSKLPQPKRRIYIDRFSYFGAIIKSFHWLTNLWSNQDKLFKNAPSIW